MAQKDVVIPCTQETCLSLVLLFSGLVHGSTVNELHELVTTADVGVAPAPCIVSDDDRIDGTCGESQARRDIRRGTRFRLVGGTLQSSLSKSVQVCVEAYVCVDIRQKARCIGTVGKDAFLVQVGGSRLIEETVIACYCSEQTQ